MLCRLAIYVLFISGFAPWRLFRFPWYPSLSLEEHDADEASFSTLIHILSNPPSSVLMKKVKDASDLMVSLSKFHFMSSEDELIASLSFRLARRLSLHHPPRAILALAVACGICEEAKFTFSKEMSFLNPLCEISSVEEWTESVSSWRMRLLERAQNEALRNKVIEQREGLRRLFDEMGGGRGRGGSLRGNVVFSLPGETPEERNDRRQRERHEVEMAKQAARIDSDLEEWFEACMHDVSLCCLWYPVCSFRCVDSSLLDNKFFFHPSFFFSLFLP